MIVISVVNQKGGVGKTTTAVNLAYQLSQFSKTLIIDLDPQGNAGSGLGVEKYTESNSIFISGIEINQLVKKTSVAKLFILPSSLDLIGIDGVLAENDNRSFILKQKLASIQGEFDYVVIDCPPSLGILTVNSLTASNYMIIPVQAEYYALEGLSQLLDTFSNIKASINPELEILGVLMTLYDKRTTLNQQVKDEVNKYFGDKIFKSVIPRNIRLAEAPSHGLTIFEYDKWSKGAKAYKNFSKEVIEKIKNI